MLVEAYPDLFRPPVSIPEGAQGWPEAADGWQDLIERACQRIRAALSEGDRFHFQQIKQKYGTLRIYWTGRLSAATEHRVLEVIDLAEARSACTCELCGNEGSLYRSGGVLMTRCAEHSQGRQVEIRPGFENLLVVYRFVDGRLRAVRCRRYERANDLFEEVDPAGQGIEEG
ncbi:hypothetical protein [Bradyrhizobium canariense]|nr:hypothetical protein [Bradyrhizobium canariense]